MRAYLTHLAVNRHVSASTQIVALASLLFLYREVLNLKLDRIFDVERARLPTRLHIVFSRKEVATILNRLSGVAQLAASLMYGSGLRLMECLRLRVKDIDFSYAQICVRDGKGAKDRMTMLPARLKEPLRLQLLSAKLTHQHDLKTGRGKFGCLTRSQRNIRTPRVNGARNTSFRLDRSALILMMVNGDATMSVRARYNVQ
jgi:integrase